MNDRKGVTMDLGLGPPSPADAVWHNPKEYPSAISGFAWFKQEHQYRRMPSKPISKLPQNVDGLADCTAGGQIRFRTDSRAISLRAILRGPANIPHLPATAQCGFDLYLGKPGKQRFCTVTKFDVNADSFSLLLLSTCKAEMRDLTINFPLYQGVEQVEIGLERNAMLESPHPYAFKKPIVIYGTSITQGACCSRPGMAFTNILSRKLNAEFINLGFSGNGRGEPEVAKVIAGISEPGLFILDYEANAAAALRQTLPTFIEVLRTSHPFVPILVLSRIRHTGELLNETAKESRHDNACFQRNLVRKMKNAGDLNIFYHDGGTLLGKDFDECTVDGVHPNDLGQYRIAAGLAPALKRIMQGYPIQAVKQRY